MKYLKAILSIALITTCSFIYGQDIINEIGANGKYIVKNPTDTLLTIKANTGNVGIGTAIPGEKLTVAGNINTTIGTNRYLRLGSATNYWWDWSAIANDISLLEAGSTARMTIKFGGNVGIGTTSPGWKLTVSGDQAGLINPNGNASFRVQSTGGGNADLYLSSQNESRIYWINNNGTKWYTRLSSGNDLLFYNFSLSEYALKMFDEGKFTIYPSGGGNVGIGTDNPTAKLEVAGQVKITGGTPGAGKVLTSDASGLGTWETPSTGGSSFWTESGGNVYRNSGNVGIGTTNPTAKLDINGRATASISFTLGTHNDNYRGLVVDNGASYGWTLLRLMNVNGEHFRINGNGNVGIGTTNPTAKLEVAGNTKLTGNYFYMNPTNGADAIINANKPLVLTTTHTGGVQIGKNYGSGDTGLRIYDGGTTNNVNLKATNGNLIIIPSNGNVGIDTANPTAKLEVAGQVKITGGTPGVGKVLTSDASGLGTWETPSTGGSSFWTESGGNVYRNSGNVGIGTTNPTAKLDINGRATASISFTLGTHNDNYRGLVVDNGASYGWTLLRLMNVNGEHFRINGNGNVGIGTTNPNAKLEVAGQVKITGGTPGDGKVLTSDATGLATWETPSTGGSSLWTESGGNVYRSNGNVGIGTSNPQDELHVYSATANANIRVQGQGQSDSWLKLYSNVTDHGLWGHGNVPIVLGQSGGIVSFTPVGNFGVGTWTPNSKLEVAGIIHSTSGGIKFPDGSVQTTAGGGGTGGDNWGTQVVQSTARLSGNGTTSSPLDITQMGAGAGQILKWNGSAWAPGNDDTGEPNTGDNDWSISGSNMYSGVAGNVGIGTNSPTGKLDINGTLRLRGHLYDYNNSTGTNGQVLTRTTNGIDWQPAPSGADNLGNHTATQNIKMSGKWLSNDGGNEGVFVHWNGNVGIGTSNQSSYCLAVNGTIRAKEIIVNTNWSDFVFNDSYKLPSLADVEQYINEHGHLPGIPSEADVLENGVSLGEMQAKLLQKIEELTLYMIELKKENERLESIVLNLK